MNFSPNEEAVNILTSLGLSRSQSIVYLTTFHYGASTANEISKLSGVNRQEIYRIMLKLQSLGLVEKKISNPIKWRAYSIKTALSYLIDQRKMKTDEIQKKSKSVISYCMENNKKRKDKEEESRFILISEKKAIFRWIRNETKKTRVSNDIISNVENAIKVLYTEQKDFTNMVNRGVTMRMILYNNEKDELLTHLNQELVDHPNFKMRYVTENPSVVFAIHDRRVALLSTKASNSNDVPALASNCPVFVRALQNYFELLWKSANFLRITSEKN